MDDKNFVLARIEELRNEFRTGKDIFCILRHVSKSGMQRAISLFCVQNNDLVNLDYSVQKICGYKFSKLHGGLTVRGCGMDMGYHIVANLEFKLFGNSSCQILKQRWI
jgi:hypothetical protein